MSTIRVNAIQNTSGVEVYTAKAWVNFNGTGTVAIRAAGNVSSITDNGTGDYTVNFTTAMPDTNYSAMVCRSRGDANGKAVVLDSGFSSTSVRVLTGVASLAPGAEDSIHVFVAIFR